MSDEIRAAAERQAKGAGPHDTDAFFRLEEDALLLARAWLAEHPAAAPAGPPPAAPKVGDRIIRPAPPEYPDRWKVLELVESSLTGRAWVTLGNYWTRADAELLCAGPRLAALEAENERLEERVVAWRAWVARTIGFDHVTTGKTDDHMRADVDGELQRLIDRIDEVQADARAALGAAGPGITSPSAAARTSAAGRPLPPSDTPDS